MTYFELKKKLIDYPIFKIEDVFKWFPKENKRTLIFQLSIWTKKGHIERLRRGVYKFSDYQIKDISVLSSFFLPSYISCETALNYYGIIPDIPFATTSVVTTKTITIKTKNYGLFIYHHIKPELFFDYLKIDSDFLYSYKIATPEKALFDFLYLQSFKKNFDPENCFKEMRLDIGKSFKMNNLKKWQKLVSLKNKKFHLSIDNLLKKYKK
jgi:predicted transcriptional regulator of viral defense system